MLGANPVASMGSLMTAPGIVRRLKNLTARGRLVVVDPRRSETAEIASEHVFIRPGTDALFLIGLLRAVLALGPARIGRYAGKLSGLDTALDARVFFERVGLSGGAAQASFETIKTVANVLEQVADRVTHRVKRSYRFVEELDTTRAKEIDTRAERTFSVQSQNTLMTAKALMKVDATQIHLG